VVLDAAAAALLLDEQRALVAWGAQQAAVAVSLLDVQPAVELGA